MTTMLKMMKQAVELLGDKVVSTHVSASGSCYIKLDGCAAKVLRFGNHNANEKRLKSRTWQIRTDAQTKRYGKNRIYNLRDFNRAISELIIK